MVNQKILDYLKNSVGSSKYNKAMKLVNELKVTIINYDYTDDQNFNIEAEVVDGEDTMSVMIVVDDGNFITRECTCTDYEENYNICIHVIAAVLKLNNLAEDKKEISTFEKDYSYGTIKKVGRDMKYKESLSLLNAFSVTKRENIDKQKNAYGTIKIIPRLEYDNYNNIYIAEFKVGNKIFYLIKDIEEFCDMMTRGVNFEYGKNLRFVHSREMFDAESQATLDFLLSYGKLLKQLDHKLEYINRYTKYEKGRIELFGSLLDDFFDMAIGTEIEISGFRHIEKVTLCEGKPNIKFRVEKGINNDYKLTGTFKNYKVIYGEKNTYLVDEEKIYRYDNQEYSYVLKVLLALDNTMNKEIIFDKESLPKLFGQIIPKIRENFDDINIKGTELEFYMPAPLGVKMYLDYNKANDIEAKVMFCYNSVEFNPYDNNESISITRNMYEEEEVNYIFRESGFKLSENATIVMHGENDIYNFISSDIINYMKKFEILASDEFNKKQIISTKIANIGVRIENSLLDINIDNLGYDISELKNIIESFNIKKKFYRLKSGEFINLEENDELEFISKLAIGTDIELKEIEKGNIKLPIYRSMYLESIMQKLKNTDIKKDKTYKTLVTKVGESNEIDIKVPKSLDSILRLYQKDGYKWLNALDEYNFGGILADDMGLGKTLEVISVVLEYIEKTPKDVRKTSIVVCPSSLTLNWRNEFIKFAPKIAVAVVKGKAEEREKIVKNLEEYDVIITSYDLLKRDISLYTAKEYTYRFVVADEAQYIKNSSTKNSQTIKQISGMTKFALTGTPIENSLSELWSIFDFIMPGYLYTYNKFRKIYEYPIVKEENYYALSSLKKQIEPFVLRRLKKDVLTELPDKTITIMKNEMSEDQQRTYAAYLVQAKEEVMSEINSNGIEKSQIKILAILTRLRQICCHPALFLNNYKGECSKFMQALELVQDSIESGHRILLFSQYTSMFDLIEKEFKELGINYFKLIGSTKVDERIRMVDEFNNNEDVKVFLISLKAGGTGLNLTGADVVIHYDPWWNLSAENQATDRAYRLGQKNNVQVYKLITENSIEEKISELQEKKAKLSESALSTEETYINKLTKEDIMKLFEE